MKTYYQIDADPRVLQQKTIAVLGYGSQGQAHARNLRDSGHRVLVAQRPGGSNHELAVAHGFEPISIAEAAQSADMLIFALPDETMGDVYSRDVAAQIREGQVLGFIHGFSIHFEQIQPPPTVDVIMIAPKGPGALLRERYVQGGGLTCILAVHQDASGQAKELALAWGAGIGGGRGGMIEATFAEECEADLFGEQTVLCGGVIELMKAGFETLVEAGIPPELAYFECIHEVKQVIDLQYEAGFASMRSRISNTASFGGLSVGRRMVTDAVRAEMRTVLREIKSGAFAREWVEECRSGKQRLAAMEAEEAAHPAEDVGRTVRSLAEKAIPGRD